MEYFNLLPSEITMDIISRLATESILECKLVSTTWRSLIRHPSFSKMHLHHLNHPAADSGKMGFIALTFIDWSKNVNFQYFEYNENHESVERIRRVSFNPPFGWDTNFVGSSNGLICLFRQFSEESTYICNPITRECLLLPEINTVGMVHRGSGFGYVTSTNEYKVVRILFVNETEFMEVYIYTLGSGNGWRNLGKFNFGTRKHWGEGVHFNGALYWLDYRLKMIVPFHLAEEKFCEHLSPPPLSNNNFDDYYHKLGVLDGCLYFAIKLLDNGAGCWDMWISKQKDENHDMKERERPQSLGWSEKVKDCDRLSGKLFAVLKSYAFLTYTPKHIHVHDPEASTSETIVEFEEHIYGVFLHKNTLVSLKELGEEDTKIMESVEIEETESLAQPFNQL